MSKQKYYFSKDALFCYPKEWHLKHMKENDINEQSVYIARIDRRFGAFFCKELKEAGFSKDCCGVNNCSKYDPRNGRSGICKKYGYCYYPAEEVILKIK